MPKPGDLKVWWIPQVPGKPFEQAVENFVEAKLLLDTLAFYDIFQFENKIKGDYSNTGGLQIYESDEEGWVDWHPTEKQEMILDKIDPEIAFYDDGLDKFTLEQVRVFQAELDLFTHVINGHNMSVGEAQEVAKKTGQAVMMGMQNNGKPRVRKFQQKHKAKGK